MLKGIRVLDFTRLLPGPFATQILADLGAEVIKVEEPNLGDYARVAQHRCPDGNAITFHGLNRGKKSITLNLKNSSDLLKLEKILPTIDIIIESFRPGVMTKLGLNSNKLLKKYNKLIICSISGYGQTGKNRLRAGHDINYISKAGLTSLMADPKLPPAQIADICGGSWPAVAQILASLYQRQITGKGNIIDVSMTDCSYSLGIYPQTISKNIKNTKISDGNWLLTNNNIPCYQIYKCKNGYISVGALEPKFWKEFCIKVIKRNDLITKGLYNGKQGKKIIFQVEKILMTKTINEWDLILKNCDCCVEVIPKSENVLENDEQLKSRGLDVEFDVGGKKYKTVGMPLNMKYGVDVQKKRGPKLGEHNKEILSKL